MKTMVSIVAALVVLLGAADFAMAVKPEKLDKVTRKLNREQARHEKRIAKFEALHDKLVARGNDQAAEQILNAIDKENARHDRMVIKITTENEDDDAEDPEEPEPEPEPEDPEP